MTEQIQRYYREQGDLIALTEYDPDTCHCKIFIDDKDGNNKSKMKLMNRCKSHTTVQQVFTHNQSFATPANINSQAFKNAFKRVNEQRNTPTQAEKGLLLAYENFQKTKDVERAKPEFQRR